MARKCEEKVEFLADFEVWRGRKRGLGESGVLEIDPKLFIYSIKVKFIKKYPQAQIQIYFKR